MRRVALVTGLALLLAAPAAGQTPLVDRGEGTQLEADARFATWVLPGGKARRLLDTRTGALSDVPVPADCSPEGIAAQQLVWLCDTNGPATWRGEVARYVDILSGRVRDREIFPGEITPATIVDAGAYWVWTYAGDHRGGSHDAYHPIGGGDYRIDPEQSSRTVFDLNHPGLNRKLCRPLVRELTHRGGEDDRDQYEQYQFEPPYGLNVNVDYSLASLELQRCGSGRTLKLETVKPGDGNLLLGTLYRGNVSWWDGGALRLRVTRPRVRRYGWTPAGGKPEAVDHTKYAVVGQAEGRVYSAQIPRP